MKFVRLLILAAAGFYVYKRFFSNAGAEETQAAEPFSSEQLPDDGAVAAQPAAAVATDAGTGQPDPLKRPSWLDPADAG